MPKFRKKPIVIEAVLYDDVITDELLAFLGDTIIKPFADGFVIPTLEGNYLAQPGDWIIKGVEGEFYPCKPNVFDATYERVED